MVLTTYLPTGRRLKNSPSSRVPQKCWVASAARSLRGSSERTRMVMDQQECEPGPTAFGANPLRNLRSTVPGDAFRMDRPSRVVERTCCTDGLRTVGQGLRSTAMRCQMVRVWVGFWRSVALKQPSTEGDREHRWVI